MTTPATTPVTSHFMTWPARFATAARRAHEQLGRGGLIGIGLALGGLALLLTVLIPMQREMVVASATLARERSEATRPALPAVKIAPRSGAEITADTINQFYSDFPSTVERTQLLGRLFQIARTSGVTMQAGDFRLTAVPDSALMRYELNLPITGSYAEVKRFVALSLEALPTLALEDLRLRRESASEARIEALLRMVHFTLADRPS